MAFPIIAAIAAAAPIIAGMAGRSAAQGDKDKAAQAMQDYYNQVNATALPDIERMRLELEKYKSAGDLTPETEQALQLSSQDNLANVNLDPRLKQTQMDQLAALSKIGESGISPIEQAQLNSIRRQTSADQQAKMQQMLEDQSRRGVGSSDAAMAARLISSQNAANSAAMQSDQAAAQAFQRALESRAQAGSLAGNIENADYSRQAALANALNSRELTNLQQQSGTQSRNIDRANTAMQANLMNKQNIANQNVGLSNNQQQYNKQLEQTNYENKLKKLGIQAGASQGLSNTYAGKAADTQQMWSDIGSGVSKGLGGFAMGGFGGAAAPAAGTVTAQEGFRAGKGIMS